MRLCELLLCSVLISLNNATDSGATSLSSNAARLIVARPSQFELYDVITRKRLISFPHGCDQINPCATFIHNGGCIIGSYDAGRARAWFVDKGGAKMFTLTHSGAISSSLYDLNSRV